MKPGAAKATSEWLSKADQNGILDIKIKLLFNSVYDRERGCCQAL